MLFLLLFRFICSDDSFQNNLTEICINPLKGDCHGVFEVQTPSDFEKYCTVSSNLTIYLINDFDTTATFNMINLYNLKQCNIIGLLNFTNIYIIVDPKRSREIDFKAENVIIDFSSHSQVHLSFKSLTLHYSGINSYIGEISAKRIESDAYSLSNLQKFYSQVFDIDTSYIPAEPLFLHLSMYTDNFDSNELQINLLGLSDNYSINLYSSNLILNYEQFDIPISFDINAIKASFNLNYTSISNSLTLYSSDQSQEMNNWVCGIYQLNIFHAGELLIELDSSDFLFGQLSVNRLNLTSTSNCLCKIFQFESANPSQSLLVDVGKNVNINLYNDFNSNAAFLGQGQVNVVSDFNIDYFKKIYLQKLSFVSNYASIKVDVTRDKKESLIMVKENFKHLNNIVIYPIFNESKFSVPDDIDSLLGQTLFSLCAPDADIESFDVHAQQYSDTVQVPPGFTSDAMSFSLQQNQNCISLVFAKDPRSFSTTACIYQSDSSLCENVTELSFDASKGETPFDKDISTQYINILIAEDLPENYFLNLSKLVGKHEIRITSLPSDSENESFSENIDSENSGELQLRKINIADFRSDTTETSLILNGVDVHFATNLTEYERIYLINGSKIINNVNLSGLNSLEFDFNYSSKYDQALYGCENIRMHHVFVDEIVYEQNAYTFIQKNKKISFSNTHTYTISFDSTESTAYRINLHILTYDIKPLIFRANTAGPLYINFTNITGPNPTTLTAIRLQVDSSSGIYFTSPTYSIPVEIISLKDSSTFEKMKRITVYSESSIVDWGFYPTSFAIHEDNVSFIAFSPSSLKPIPSYFSEIDFLSDTYIISESYVNGQHTFGNISYIANDIKIGSGVKTTLIYGMILNSISISDNSQLNLFHVSIRNIVTVNYVITLGKKSSIINLVENQSKLDIPSKAPLYIKDDLSVFLPKVINVEHKLPHRKALEFLDAGNDTVEYCILMLKSSDRCDALSGIVKFDPSEIHASDGIYTFTAVCKPECLAVSCEFHKDDSKPTSGILDKRNIIIIASLSGVLLIAIIIIVVLVVKRKQNPNDYMKSLLLTLPSDM